MKRDLWISALVAIGAANGVQAGVDLVPGETLGTEGVPQAVLLADVDGDAIDDVVIAASGLEVRLSGTGETVVVDSGSFAALAEADFNNDFTPDIVGVHADADRASVFLLDPAGSVVASHVLVTGSSPVAVTAGQLDTDGYPDIVIANADDDSVSIFYSADGFAAAVPVSVGDYPVALAVVDIDGDTRDDVLVLNLLDSSVSAIDTSTASATSIYQVPVDGSFVDHTSMPVAMAVDDVNGDTYPDLVMASLLGNALRFHPGDGAGSFTAGATLSTNWHVPHPEFSGTLKPSDPAAVLDIALGVGSRSMQGLPRALELHDMDADGDPDLVVSSLNRKAVALFPNDGSGFGAGVNYALASEAWSMALGHRDTDGRPDVVVVQPDAASVQVLENSETAGWPPAAENGSITLDECSSMSAGFDAVDPDGSALRYELLAIEPVGAWMPAPAAGTISIGDSSGDGSVIAGEVTPGGSQPAVSNLNEVTGTFTLTVGDTGGAERLDWNIHFRASDTTAGSDGWLQVAVTGDGSISTCGALDLASPDAGVVTIEEPLAGAPADEEAPSIDPAAPVASGGGAPGWLLLPLGLAGIWRRATTRNA